MDSENRGFVESVNVGQAFEVTWNRRTFTTAIRKHPVDGRVAVRGVNVDGDDQADRSVHGGRSKALYAYAIEDYAWWAGEATIAPEPGLFGENLTLRGIDLTNCLIGERWQIGSSILEVSEPRLPCFKLGYRMGDAAFPAAFARALRPGSYFRIVEEGVIGAGDPASRVFRPKDHDVTVREVMRIRLFAHDERQKLSGVAALSLDYRDWAMLEPDRT